MLFQSNGSEAAFSSLASRFASCHETILTHNKVLPIFFYRVAG
jgi:hypothetical protein